jgi:hypothetical protein
MQQERLVRQLVRARHPARCLTGRDQKAVVRPHEDLSPARLDRNGPPGGTDRWVYHGKVHAFRLIGGRLFEDDGAVAYVLPQDVVVHVDDAQMRCDAEHHAMTHPHELILEPVIGEKGDYVTPFHDRSILSGRGWVRPPRYLPC